MKNTRKLSQREKAILDRLLKEPFPGRDELRAQIANARVKAIDEYYGSIEFQVNDGPKAPVLQRVPVDAFSKDADGMLIEVLLHVVDGVVDELEVIKYDGTPIQRHPEASDLTVRTYSASNG
jgi:hypothetical protein